jgi:signal transduction histidine kinase
MNNWLKKIFFISGFVISIIAALYIVRFSMSLVKGNLERMLLREGSSIASVLSEGASITYDNYMEKERQAARDLLRIEKRIPDVPDRAFAEKLADEGFPSVLIFDSDYDIIYRTDIVNSAFWNSAEYAESLCILLSEEDEEEFRLFGFGSPLPGVRGFRGLVAEKGSRTIVVFSPETGAKDGAGIGSLFRNSQESSKVRYIVLQTESGLLVASKNVERLSSFSEDTILPRVLTTQKAAGRFRRLGGRTIFEVISPFPEKNNLFAVVRVGIDLGEYFSVVSAISYPMVFIMFLLVFMAFMLIYNQFLSKRLTRAEDISKGFTTRTDLIYIEFDNDGRILEMNYRAQKLFSSSVNSENNVHILFPEGIPDILPSSGFLDYTAVPVYGRFLNIHAEPFGSDTKKRNWFLLAEDVTELYDLKKRAQELHHLQGLSELVSTIAHDIRNPLNAISIATQRLDMELTDKSDDNKEGHRRYLDAIGFEIGNLNRMIEDFLALSSPVALKKELIFPSLFLSSVVQSVAFICESSGVEIELVTEQVDEIVVSLDTQKLSRAVSNILKNAIEASHKGTTVQVRSSILEGNLIIMIENHGEPIPEEYRASLFTPKASRKEHGYGLGLFSAYRIVRSHGGDIKAESLSEKTVFTITLPLETEQ